MKLYRRNRDDQLNACRRSLFDARHGRVKLALERINDVLDEGFHDRGAAAEAVYTKGVILRDFLGRGFQARDLFEEAYEQDSNHTFSIINATQLARNLEEFRKWTQIFHEKVPPSEERSHAQLDRRWQMLNQGGDYRDILHDLAITHGEGGITGQAASLMELALDDYRFSIDEEAGKRCWRAQQLRVLDREAEDFRRANSEDFPPDERLALMDALVELERGIELDPYNVEMLNLKAAWFLILRRYAEVLPAADLAMELRPRAYPKPYINKAQALWRLHRDAEALTCIQDGLRQAEDAGHTGDTDQAKELCRRYSRPRAEPSLREFLSSLDLILQGALILADIEVGEHDSEHEIVIIGFFNRCRRLHGSPSIAYVPIVAGLLSDFCPERAFHVVSHLTQVPELLSRQLPGHGQQTPRASGLHTLSQEAYDHCLHAALYVAAHSEGVQRRDAARFLCLALFGALEAESVRACYREAVLETSAAATDAMAQLDSIVREELRCIHPELPRWIADQEPVTEAERERAMRNMHLRFQPRPGCMRTATSLGVVVLVALSLVFGIWTLIWS